MIIDGYIEYNNNGILTEKNFNIDTSIVADEKDCDICDAVSFALFGKTVFNEIVQEEKGVPTISLKIQNKGKSIEVFREPEFWQKTFFGSVYLSEEEFGITTENDKYSTNELALETGEYKPLTGEKYYALLNDYIDISYDEFVLMCKS